MNEPKPPGPSVAFLEATLAHVIDQRNHNAQLHAEALARAALLERELQAQTEAVIALRTEFEALKAKVLGDAPADTPAEA